MRQEKIQKLKALADILSKMDEENSMNILNDMDREFRIDRDALDYLAVNIFRPEEIFEKFDKKGLSLVLRGMTIDSLSKLIEGLNEKNISSCAEILGRNRFQDALDIERKPPRGAMIEDMLKVMSVKISAGEISYKGPALFLMDIPCRPAPEATAKKGKVFFCVINPVVFKDEGVRVLIYNPYLTEGELRLSFQQKGERYFVKNSWFRSILTDDNGFYYAELFPDRKPGMNTLWLEIPGMGQSGRNIYFTDSARSVFSVSIDGIDEPEEGMYRISFSLPGHENGHNYARIKIFCTRCGLPLVTAGVYLEKKKGEVEFSYSGGSGHCDDLYFHVEVGKHQACAVINIVTDLTDPGRAVIGEDRAPGNMISAVIPVAPGEPFMFHVSSSSYTDRSIRQSIAAGRTDIHGRVKYRGERKSSVLEASESDGDLLMMPSRESMSDLRFGVVNNSREFNYQSSGRDNFNDLHFTFYRLTSTGPVPFYNYVSCVDRKVKLYPILPAYLEKGESSEIEILYRTDHEMQVSLTNGITYDSTVTGKGIIRNIVEYGHDYTLSSGGADLSEQKISIPERGDVFSWSSIEYIPPGSIIVPDANTEYLIYNGPGAFCDEIRKKMLINYQWGCAEQTAAKLSALCWLYVNDKSHDQNIVLMIQGGVKKLLTYRNSSGLYSLFGQEYDMRITVMILRHFLPVKKFESRLKNDLPEIIDVINDLVSICEKEKYASDSVNIPLNMAAVLAGSPIDESVDYRSLLENTGKSLAYEKERFYMIPISAYMSGAAYLSYVASSVIATGRTSIEAVTSRKKMKKVIRRGGIAGFLEMLGILTRKTEIKVSDKTSMIDNSLEPLLSSLCFRYMNNSSMSTVEMQGLLALLSLIEEKNPEYSYSSGKKPLEVDEAIIPASPVKIESDYTFVKKTVVRKISTGGDGIYAALSENKKVRGGNLILKIKKEMTAHCVYTIYFPAILEPAFTAGMILSPQSIRIDSSSFDRSGGITFKAARRGKGRVRIIYEYMYDPSRADVVDAGWVEVL